MLRSRTLWQIVSAALVLAGAVALYLARPGEPDARRYPVRGIDVSHHQGPVVWRRLRTQHIRFVYLKASEGGDWRDPLFARSLSQGSASGVAVGAYHYFTLCAAGRVQAANFLGAVAGRPLSLPPAVDVEYVGNCAARPPRAVVVRQLRAFLDAIRARTSRAPVLYTTQRFFDDYLSGPDFASDPFWVRDLVGEAEWSKGRKVLFRQFADHGRFDGVAGPVDVDVFFGSEKDFAALLRG